MVHFTTTSYAQAERDENIENCPPTLCAHGQLAFRTTAHNLLITGAPVAGQRLVVEIDAGGYSVCVLTIRPCPSGAMKDFYRHHILHTVRLHTSTVTLAMPRRHRGEMLRIAVTFPQFTAHGYQWKPNTLLGSQR